MIRFALTLLICWSVFTPAHAKGLPAVTVFAAASTTNAIRDIGNLYAGKQMGRIIYSFASSSTLAKQIARGAPADIFISADPQWMDYLQARKLLAPGTRFDLLGNRIVLIAPRDSKVVLSLSPGVDLVGLLGPDMLAMGDPGHVPAGIYGKKALQSLGIWEGVAARVARSKDVRAALTLVERAEAPLGIVYATDAAISQKVKVIATFPKVTHPAITYPVAAVAERATPAAKALLEFLRSPRARMVFERYGFSVR